MTQKQPHPLRLEPPVRTADEALGERLALLARASKPSAVRRRVAWRAPIAGLAIVAGTGGLAYGAQSVVHHITTPPQLAPGHTISPSASPSEEQAEVRPPATTSASEAAAEDAGRVRAHGKRKAEQGRGHGDGDGASATHRNPGQGNGRDHATTGPGKAVGKGAGIGAGAGTGSGIKQGSGHGKADERGEVSGAR